MQAAEVCLRTGLVNSAASRAYYAMFQAAQAALEAAGFARPQWSHPALQAALATELIHRRKLYPAVFRDYLSTALRTRHVADYGDAGITQRVAGRAVRRATAFVTAVEQEVSGARRT